MADVDALSRNYSFLVDIEDFPRLSFTRVELPELGIDAIEYREGGDNALLVRKLPGRPSIGTAVLRRAVDGNRTLYQWWDGIRSGDATRRDVVVTMLRPSTGDPLRTWVLRRTFPVRFAFSELDARGSDVIIESIELAVEDVEDVM